MAETVKNLPAIQETWVQSLGQEDPRRRVWQATPVFLPREFHRQRSLASYSLWGCKELVTTKQLTLSFFYSHQIGRDVGKQEPLYIADRNIRIDFMQKILHT